MPFDFGVRCEQKLCRLLQQNSKSGNRHTHAHAWISLYSEEEKNGSYCLVYGWWRLNLIVFAYIYFTILVTLSMLVAVAVIAIRLSRLSYICMFDLSWSLAARIIHSFFFVSHFSFLKIKNASSFSMLFIQNRILMCLCVLWIAIDTEVYEMRTSKKKV